MLAQPGSRGSGVTVMASRRQYLRLGFCPALCLAIPCFLRDIVKAEDIVDYTQHEGLPERVLKKFGAAMGAGAMKAAVKQAQPSLR